MKVNAVITLSGGLRAAVPMLRAPVYQPLSELDQRIFDATVPQDHYLRRVLRAVDFERCRPLLAAAYDPARGRPASEPVLLLKLEFLQYHYNLSDRQVVDQARYNMAFRLFLGLGLHSPLPDPSLLTYFRRRLGAEGHQRLFDDVVGQARAQGLVKDRLRLKDATHVLANIAIPSTIALVAQTRTRLLQALRPWAAERVASEERQAEAIRTATADLSGEERLLQRVAHLRAVTAWAEEIPGGAAFADAPEAERQALAAALPLAHKVLADRDDPDGTDHLVSVQDPQARRAKHGDYFTGYLLDVAMDADSQVVTAVNVLPGHGPEAQDAVTLLAREEQAHGNDVQALSMDGAGFHGQALRALTAPGGPQVEVYVPPKEVPPTGLFTAEQFTLDAAGQVLTCPGGQTTAKKRRSYRDGGWQFRFPRPVCAACPLQGQCLPRLPQTLGRVVTKNDHEQEYQAARARAQTAAYRAVRREHPAIERKLGEMVRWHRARWARYRGQGKVLLQGLLTGLVVNVKRLVSWAGDAAGGGAVRAGWAGTG
jgi:transposase